MSLNDVENLPQDYEVDEPAMTFEGNAIIKAMTFGKKTGFIVLTDDSGLEVDALDGRPGVYSARYVSGTDEDRNRELLKELKNVPDHKRGAQFRCVIALYDPQDEKIRTCDGVCRGRIAREPKGDNGFGYDPIFYSEELGKTTAEMGLEEKNSISHRGKALERAYRILEDEFLN